MEEIWISIINYEGKYDISNFARIRSITRWRDNRHGGYIQEGRILKQRNRNGYNAVSLCKNGKTYQLAVHRLVAQAFIPNPENKWYVNHKDSNKRNNNDWNLEWTTPKENTRHAMINGQFNPLGENHPRAKLINQQVKEILMLRGILTQKELAEKYGVTQSCISLIHCNKHWTHI